MQKTMNAGPYLAGPTTCRRSLNIEVATNELEGAVADMREAIEALSSHLAPLLSHERPTGEGCERIKGDSEVAERIMSQADVIRGRSACIRDLIDRL